MNDPEKLLDNLQNKLNQVKTLNDLDNLQTKFLGRNGLLNQFLKKMASLPQGERKEYGVKINQIKNSIEKALEHKKNSLVENAETEKFVDVTLPGTRYPSGSLHMVSLAIEEISRIFEKIGFSRVSYPEIEWEYFAFEALNMPPLHPARDDFETFFVNAPPSREFGKMVLTPHTSSGQPREMLRVGKPPIRMINIAKTYRPNWDATHTPMFHQFEGLEIGKSVNITHLKGIIDYFAKEFFGPDREIRLRPFHFQFTEPSFEIDISCGVCGGSGVIEEKKCKVCKSGWLELGGSGMVHPNVLKAGKIDPEEYSGWAFGFGVERTFMMKEGFKLDDIRVLYNNDIRFLEHF